MKKLNNTIRHCESRTRAVAIHPLDRFVTSFLAMTTVLIFILYILPLKIFASSTITAIPPRLQIEAKPGETIKTTIRVRNDSDISQNYTVFVNDFIVDDLNETPIPISENVTGKWSLRKWITAPSFLPVDSKATQNVELLIRVPSSALPGGHYAMITYMPNADLKPNELKKTATIIGQRVGTLIYLTIKGKITENANIIAFNAPQFIEKGPVLFTGTVENISDIHVQPKGDIIISDIFNKEVAKIPVDLGNIFPENKKLFNASWNQKWGYGRYKAELNLVYGSTDSVLTANIFFWLFPIRLTIYILVALISILTVIILLSKKGKKHQEELEKEVRELQREIDTLERR